jgi:hypothetical protein
MNRHLLYRRQFNAFCAAVGLSFPAASAIIGALSGVETLTDRRDNGSVFGAPDSRSAHWSLIPISLAAISCFDATG